MARLQKVQDYLDGRTGPLPDELVGLLVMSQRRRRVLGVELHGDTARRQVLQTAVSFSDHRYLAPADVARLTRRELKKRAFDFQMARASDRMVGKNADAGIWRGNVISRDVGPMRCRRPGEETEPVYLGVMSPAKV